MMNVLMNDPSYEEMTNKFKDEFVSEIMRRSNEMMDDSMTPQKARFREAAKRYQLMNSSELFIMLSDIFRRECALLRDYESGNYTSYVSATREIETKIEYLRQQLSAFEALDYMEWKKNFENYQVEQLGNQLNLNGFGSPSHAIEIDLHMSSANLFSEKLKSLAPMLAAKLKNFCENSDQLINHVIDDYIKQWKFNQQKYGNNDFNINGAELTQLQSWCGGTFRALLKIQEIIDCIQENRGQIEPGVDNLTSMLMALRQATSNSMIKLVRGSVIIENQPPQVIKTNTK